MFVFIVIIVRQHRSKNENAGQEITTEVATYKNPLGRDTLNTTEVVHVTNAKNPLGSGSDRLNDDAGILASDAGAIAICRLHWDSVSLHNHESKGSPTDVKGPTL